MQAPASRVIGAGHAQRILGPGMSTVIGNLADAGIRKMLAAQLDGKAEEGDRQPGGRRQRADEAQQRMIPQPATVRGSADAIHR